MKKWINLLGGVVMQSSLGGLYAWSTLVSPLQIQLGFTRFQSGLVFGVMVGTFAFATIPAGRLFVRIGPKYTGILGSILFAIGYWIASFSGTGFPQFILGLGLITGIGIGLGYVCPLSVGMKWFPHRKGLVTGIMVAGFGFGALYVSSLLEILLLKYDVLTVLRIVGTLCGGGACAAAFLLSEPEGEKPGQAHHLFHLKTIVHSKKFLLLWIGMFVGTFCGLLISGHLKPMVVSRGLRDSVATLAVPLFAVGNTLGRLIWGRLYDKWGPQRTVERSISFLFVSITLLLIGQNPALLLVSVVGIGFGFGSCFVIYASSVADLFGIHNVPKIYPFLFGSYGISALIGPSAGGILADYTSSYVWGLIASIALLGITVGILKLSKGLVIHPH